MDWDDSGGVFIGMFKDNVVFCKKMYYIFRKIKKKLKSL